MCLKRPNCDIRSQREIRQGTKPYQLLDGRARQARRRCERLSGEPYNSCLATKIESTVRYLGIEVDDALAIAEQSDVRTIQSGRACFVRLIFGSFHPDRVRLPRVIDDSKCRIEAATEKFYLKGTATVENPVDYMFNETGS